MANGKVKVYKASRVPSIPPQREMGVGLGLFRKRKEHMALPACPEVRKIVSSFGKAAL